METEREFRMRVIAVAHSHQEISEEALQELLHTEIGNKDTWPDELHRRLGCSEESRGAEQDWGVFREALRTHLVDVRIRPQQKYVNMLMDAIRQYLPTEGPARELWMSLSDEIMSYAMQTEDATEEVTRLLDKKLPWKGQKGLLRALRAR